VVNMWRAVHAGAVDPPNSAPRPHKHVSPGHHRQPGLGITSPTSWGAKVWLPRQDSNLQRPG
jgi:hypothetical protein